MQSFDRGLYRALREPCAEPRADVQTCRRADLRTFVLVINCRDVCRDNCMGNCMDVWLIVRTGVRVGD